MSEVLVIGHRNPDTDAICSAIGYAEFKRRTGVPGAIAARCGDTNERIDFVLEAFGVHPPRFVADVSPKVRDVMANQVVSVRANATVAEALGAMGLESFSERLSKYERNKLIVVVGNRVDIQDLAIREKVRCIIVTGDLPV